MPEELDPLKVASDSHKLVFENQFVRVLETHVPPGKTEPWHQHGRRVVVYLSDFHTRTTERGHQPHEKPATMVEQLRQVRRDVTRHHGTQATHQRQRTYRNDDEIRQQTPRSEQMKVPGHQWSRADKRRQRGGKSFPHHKGALDQPPLPACAQLKRQQRIEGEKPHTKPLDEWREQGDAQHNEERKLKAGLKQLLWLPNQDDAGRSRQ